MADHPPPSYGLLAVGLVMVAITIGLIVQVNKSRAPLHDSDALTPPIYKTVQPFALTNHLGQPADLQRYLGKSWVAHIIFTRCPGPCARMTEFFSKFQSKLPSDGSVRLVSLTSDPDFDTVKVLSAYAAKASARAGVWDFLTGPKADIVKVAVDGMGLTTLDKEEKERTSANDLFIHSTVSVVIDPGGNVRGSVETLEQGAEERLLELLKTLRAASPAKP